MRWRLSNGEEVCDIKVLQPSWSSDTLSLFYHFTRRSVPSGSARSVFIFRLSLRSQQITNNNGSPSQLHSLPTTRAHIPCATATPLLCYHYSLNSNS